MSGEYTSRLVTSSMILLSSLLASFCSAHCGNSKNYAATVRPSLTKTWNYSRSYRATDTRAAPSPKER
jgi:hypothetical protein